MLLRTSKSWVTSARELTGRACRVTAGAVQTWLTNARVDQELTLNAREARLACASEVVQPEEMARAAILTIRWAEVYYCLTVYSACSNWTYALVSYCADKCTRATVLTWIGIARIIA